MGGAVPAGARAVVCGSAVLCRCVVAVVSVCVSVVLVVFCLCLDGEACVSALVSVVAVGPVDVSVVGVAGAWSVQCLEEGWSCARW